MIAKPFYFWITSRVFLTVVQESLKEEKKRSRTKSKIRTLDWRSGIRFGRSGWYFGESKLSIASTTLPSQISMWLIISSAGTSRTWRSCSVSKVMVHDPKNFQVRGTKPMRKWFKGSTKTQDWQDLSVLEAETLRHMNSVFQALCSPHGREGRVSGWDGSMWVVWSWGGNPWREHEDACSTL